MEYQKISEAVSEPFSENLKKLQELFPSVVKDGEVDFEALKDELGEFTEVGQEWYGLNWAGKRAAKKLAGQRLVGKTLKYIPSESKNPESTENLYIEGDNLEALKLLQNSYRGKIKMIYIDPPYNTGKDFVYNDKYASSQKESDLEEGFVNEEGERLEINNSDSAKYHANWLSMMYPRLEVAKTLLSEDGVIFISIDDYEIGNLRVLCDQVFGRQNLINTRSLVYHIPDGSNKGFITRAHEYILPYAKNIKNLKPFIRPDGEKLSSERCTNTPTKDNPTSSIIFKKGLRYAGDSAKISGIIGDKEPIEVVGEMIFNDGKLVNDVELRSSWRNKDQIEAYMRDGIAYDESGQEVIEIFFEKSGKPKYTKRLTHYPLKSVIPNVKDTLYDDLATSTSFENPKPVELIQLLTSLVCNDGDTVLDFFSGSGTTANSVFCHNIKMQKSCNFILIQLDENLDVSLKKVTGKAKTHIQSMISYLDSLGKPHLLPEIGKERIRRAGEKIKAENPLAELDVGFKVFKVDDTNIRWLAAEAGKQGITLEDALTAGGKDLRDFMNGTNDLDVVYEILIRQYGIPLTAPIDLLSDIGERTYSIADTVIVCLEEDVTDAVVDKIANLEPIPQKIVFRDSAFGDNISLKENAMLRLDALMQKHAVGGRQPYSIEFL